MHLGNARWIVVAGLLIIMSGAGQSVLAQDPAGEPAADTSTMGWGPRVGLGTDPDQLILGVHWDVGLSPHLRLVPNLELGLGDDHTILSTTVPLHYVFREVDPSFFPYVGGGITLGFVNHDPPGGGDDEDDLEAALRAIGGMEWRLSGRTDFFTEANIEFGDIHDLQLLAGWTFR